MVTIPQEVKNWLLKKHHAHTLKFKRKHSQMKLTSFYLFELFNSFSISVWYNKHMVSASRLGWCSTERPGSRIFVAFLRVVMFTLRFHFHFRSDLKETRELIFHQFTISLLFDHFKAVFRLYLFFEGIDWAHQVSTSSKLGPSRNGTQVTGQPLSLPFTATLSTQWHLMNLVVNLVAMFASRRLITYRNNLLLETSESIGICHHWRALVTKF